MLVVRTEGGYVVRMDAGEEVLASLADFVLREGIAGGSISELVSLSGNITWVDGEDHPMIHAHVTLAGADFVAIGGHLFSGEIAVTGELFVIPTEVRLSRELDERTGLKLIHGGLGIE
jgi:predicted DNA-binding protein with PD1-like motif